MLMGLRLTKEHENVIPAQAGIQNAGKDLDSHLRGNDGYLGVFSDEGREVLERKRSREANERSV